MTPTQIEQANVLINKYGFCTLETQKMLQENGFFDKVNVEHHLLIPIDDENHQNECRVLFTNDIKLYGNYSDKLLSHSRNTKCIIPMPQFHKVWNILPPSIYHEEIGTHYFREMGNFSFCYKSAERTLLGVVVQENITEAACKLWLKLKKGGLLND